MTKTKIKLVKCALKKEYAEQREGGKEARICEMKGIREKYLNIDIHKWELVFKLVELEKAIKFKIIVEECKQRWEEKNESMKFKKNVDRDGKRKTEGK